MTCKNCRYYVEINSGFGDCRFNAPYLKKEQRYKYYPNTGITSETLIEDICHKEWVMVSDYEWCGQFKEEIE